MRRKLVCTNDLSGHWARRRLPRESLAVEKAVPIRTPLWRREETGLFLISYFAFFTAIYTFIF